MKRLYLGQNLYKLYEMYKIVILKKKEIKMKNIYLL